MNKNQLRLVSAMSAFAIASTGVIAPISSLPSADAFDSIGMSQDLLIIHSQKTEQGHKITLNNEDFKNISEGVQVQTFLDNDLYVMVDQLVVDTADMVAKYGFDYEVEFHFNYTDNGFNFKTYVKSGSLKEELAIDSSVGIIVQIPQTMFDTDESSQLYFGTQKAEQLNDDGIIYAVLYESGNYEVTKDGSVPTKSNESNTVVSVPDFYAPTDSDSDIINVPLSNKSTSSSKSVSSDSKDDIQVVYNNPTQEREVEGGDIFDTIGRDEAAVEVDTEGVDIEIEGEGGTGNEPSKGKVTVKTQEGYREENDLVQAIKETKASSVPKQKDDIIDVSKNTIVQNNVYTASAQSDDVINVKEGMVVKQNKVGASAPKTVTGSNVYIEEEIDTVKSFDDTEGIQFESEINALADMGVITGYSESIFMPTSNITRGHFSVILARALGLKVTDDTSSKFEDTQNRWFTGSVNALANAGYVFGTTPTTFSPDNSITKQQVGTVIHRILEDKGIAEGVATSTFTDISKVSDFAKEGIAKLKTMNIVTLDEQGSFNPYEPITRGETASMVYRMLKILQNN